MLAHHLRKRDKAGTLSVVKIQNKKCLKEGGQVELPASVGALREDGSGTNDPSTYQHNNFPTPVLKIGQTVSTGPPNLPSGMVAMLIRLDLNLFLLVKMLGETVVALN